MSRDPANSCHAGLPGGLLPHHHGLQLRSDLPGSRHVLPGGEKPEQRDSRGRCPGTPALQCLGVRPWPPGAGPAPAGPSHAGQGHAGGSAAPLLALRKASYLIQTQHYKHFSGNKLLLDTVCDCFSKTMRGGSVPSSTDKVSGDRGISIHHINLQLILRNQYFSLRTCESWAIRGKNLFRLTP